MNGKVEVSGRSSWMSLHPGSPHRSQSFPLREHLTYPNENFVEMGIVIIAVFARLEDPDIVSTPD